MMATPPVVRARRVTPNPDKPKLPEELEERILPIDEKSSDCYTAIEDAVAKLNRAIDEAAPSKIMELTDTQIQRIITAAIDKDKS